MQKIAGALPRLGLPPVVCPPPYPKQADIIPQILGLSTSLRNHENTIKIASFRPALPYEG